MGPVPAEHCTSVELQDWQGLRQVLQMGVLLLQMQSLQMQMKTPQMDILLCAPILRMLVPRIRVPPVLSQVMLELQNCLQRQLPLSQIQPALPWHALLERQFSR